MLEKFLNLLPKELLIILLISAIVIIIWFVHRSLEQVRKLVKKRDEELNKDFTEIKDILKDFGKKLDSLDEKIVLDSEGTKASLYYNIDQLLTFAELFRVWSSQLKETYEKMYRSYMKLGNGLDDGKTFESRASLIEVNDTKFHDMISTYNKNRRKLFLEHLEKAEAMF